MEKNQWGIVLAGFAGFAPILKSSYKKFFFLYDSKMGAKGAKGAR
jgi:hypothetical protein